MVKRILVTILLVLGVLLPFSVLRPIAAEQELAVVPTWVARYDGTVSGNEHAQAIAVDAQGNVYVTGSANRAGPFSDFTIVKYSPAGDALWVAYYDGAAGRRDTPRADASGTRILLQNGNYAWSGLANPGGAYEVIVPPENCEPVKVTRMGFLPAKKEAIPVDGDLALPDARLLAGNANGAGVNVQDLVLVTQGFSRKNPYADINGDGKVDILDLAWE